MALILHYNYLHLLTQISFSLFHTTPDRNFQDFQDFYAIVLIKHRSFQVSKRMQKHNTSIIKALTF